MIEKDTNTLYLLGIFENIFSPGNPVIQPKFTIVTSFDLKNGSYDKRTYSHKIIIRHESGKELVSLGGQINFQDSNRAQYIGKFIGLPFMDFGVYTVEIYLDNELQPLSNFINIVKK
ncbi:MAG: hypothetical protein HYZ63_02505 [Candidatus Andersenbacteria bacterium]|nr:hypothetical protein [Candidatus Andersenbacteria bacterium]